MSTTDNRTPPASTADPKDMSPRSADEALDGLDPQVPPDELLSALYELETGRVRFLN